MPEERQKPLDCPDCGATVRWNSSQFVCSKCEWTEYKENPPASQNPAVPEEFQPPTSVD